VNSFARRISKCKFRSAKRRSLAEHRRFRSCCFSYFIHLTYHQLNTSKDSWYTYSFPLSVSPSRPSSSRFTFTLSLDGLNMDIPSAYNSPMNSHPTTPLPSQPGTTNPSPSTSVSTSLINKPGTPHAFGGSRRRVPASGLSDRTRRALDGIRTFLGSKSCYDILPESFR
jgi:hypothetical protein